MTSSIPAPWSGILLVCFAGAVSGAFVELAQPAGIRLDPAPVATGAPTAAPMHQRPAASARPTAVVVEPDGTTPGEVEVTFHGDGGGGVAGACPGSGDCCVPNGTPGCSDFECCDFICFIDSYCCDVEWD